MLVVPRRQSLPLLVLILAIVASAWWVGRPASEAAAPPAPSQSAPPQPTVTGAGNIAFAMSPTLTLPITSFQFGAGRSVSRTGEASDLSLSEVNVTLASSTVDPRLLEAMGDGDFMASVTVTSPDKNGRRTWEMTNVILSGASWSRDTKAGNLSLSLNYATVTLTTYDSKGQVVGSYCAVNRPGSSCSSD